mmetsp:Transcript_23187/g.22683  ORF Transcript_23187/g.22683 Transcript_23187/m.22683 type:complete len:174 (-) Transcript_23187:90-611(-)
MFYDHDFIKGVMGSFQILDLTNYPMTLDPTIKYTHTNEPPVNQVLGLRDTKDKKPMMEFDLIMYHYPIERTCPLQGDMYDKKLNLKLNSMKVNYIQEYFFRLNDYFFYQFLGAVSDSNPYQKLVDQMMKENEALLKGYDSRPINLKDIPYQVTVEEEEKKTPSTKGGFSSFIP